MTNLDDVLARLNPKVAKSLKRASEREVVKYPFASIGLTRATSGGVVAGQITTIYGNTSAGKSLLCSQSIGNWQRMGLSAAYLDVESTFDPDFAARAGLNPNELILTAPRSFGAISEQAVPLLDAEVDILVIDSISMALPEVFVGDDGHAVGFDRQKQIGAHAKSVAMLLNNLHYANKKTAIIIISQTTTDLSGMHPMQVPHGGKKLPFASGLMVRLTSSSTEKEQIKGDLLVGDRIMEQPIGRKVNAYVQKNKFGRQSTTASYNLYYAGDYIGIDNIDETVTLAEEEGIIQRGGAWYSYGEERWQGKPKLVAWLKENPGELEKLQLELERIQ
jgi:recombination protein RecA